MSVIAPPPRSGITADELIRPCGGANEPTKNLTTFGVGDQSEFILRPGHGSGNIIFNYFLDTTVSNDTKSYPLANVPIPQPGTYTTKIDFASAGLKSGQQIVVQAIYNGTDSGKTEEYYVCFDVKLADKAPSSASGEDHSSANNGDHSSANNGDHSSASNGGHSSETSAASSFAMQVVSLKAALGAAAAGLLVAAAAF
ncbi:hypothetical protein LPJ61_000507 [Coemansia biformis]|uniref:Copper acquisition factor BIM1-like domain-containing protein n=1 Tax=Coemansia biformis TaxID=1286918 RepID=A0A9W7YI80_9FUNG|nr:hypothetical protein LPJ61_000507 [Coemansia biformis]